MAKKKKVNVRNYFILPISFLLLNAVEEVVIYKLEMITNPWVQTAAIMALLLVGISMVAFVFIPFFEGGLVNLHTSSKRNYGRVGEIVFMVAVLLVVYFLYYYVYIRGPEQLLPPDLRNPII